MTEQEYNKLIEKMQVISLAIRDYPIPNFEQKKNDDDAREVKDVGFASDGSLRTYFKEYKYPVRFFTPIANVNAVASFKRLFALFLGKGLIGIIALIIFKDLWIEWLEKYIELNKLLLKERNWSQPVKEIRRVLKDELHPTIVNAISLVLENDMAYRYRLQDCLTNDIDTTLNILISREHDRNVKLWKILKKFSWLFRTKANRILSKVNLEETKLSIEDIFWTNIVPNYDYRGLSYELRIQEHEKERSIQ